MLPLLLPHPCLFLFMFSLSVLLLFLVAAFASSLRPFASTCLSPHFSPVPWMFRFGLLVLVLCPLRASWSSCPGGRAGPLFSSPWHRPFLHSPSRLACLFLLLPLDNSCTSCPLSTLHRSCSCSPCRVLPPLPPPFASPDIPILGRLLPGFSCVSWTSAPLFPGRSCPASMLFSSLPLNPHPPDVPLPRALPLPSRLLHSLASALLFMLFLPFLAAAAASFSFCGPGRSIPALFLP